MCTIVFSFSSMLKLVCSSPLFISPWFSFLHPYLSLLLNAIAEIHTQFWWRKRRDCGMQLNILERWVCCPAAWDHIIVPQGCTQLDTYDITQSSSLPALIWGICWCLPPLQCVFFFSFFLWNLHFNSWCATCSFWRDNVCQAHGNNTEWETLPLLVYLSVSE